MNRLKEKYLNEITPNLVSKFEYKSVMQTPKIEKIVVNMVLVKQFKMQKH
jgi:large subunit ribosomal protein L5